MSWLSYRARACHQQQLSTQSDTDRVKVNTQTTIQLLYENIKLNSKVAPKIKTSDNKKQKEVSQKQNTNV